MNRLASLARAAAPLASRVVAAAPVAAPAGATAAAEAAAAAGAAVCGRGDKRTVKGKRFKHSNGAAVASGRPVQSGARLGLALR
jgi:hypothetical protein